MFEILQKGGIMMIPIVLASVLAISIVLERLIIILRSSHDPQPLFEHLVDHIKKGQFDMATEDSMTQRTPIARLLTAVLAEPGGYEMKKERAGVVGSEEMRQLKKRVNVLSIIGALTPLMGLLGTVIGMVRVFQRLAESGGNADITVMAGGIWEALLTTAAGMAVAIPTLIFYHYFMSRLRRIDHHMKHYAMEILRHLRIHGKIDECHCVSLETLSLRKDLEKQKISGGSGD